MEEKERASAIGTALAGIYPDAPCALQADGDPFKLLVMAILSAQCTDARVNAVSGPLFEAYPDAAAMANSDPGHLEELVRSCGLYRTKAKNIRAASRILTEQYGGEIPREMESLCALPGVGRKIANLMRGDLFGYGGIVADTHCIRLCGRMGFYPETVKDPLKVERIMSRLIPESEQSDFCHRLVLFGREWCSARAPRCAECPIRQLCRHHSGQE
jgi:endonuclease-3